MLQSPGRERQRPSAYGDNGYRCAKRWHERRADQGPVMDTVVENRTVGIS